MKRESWVVFLAFMLVIGFILSPISSELNEEPELNIPQSRARNILIVGSNQTYTTISAAITAANAGDTILVYAGTYNEKVILSKTLTLIGNGSADTIIMRSNADVPLEIITDWCNVSGFNLTGSGSAATDAGLVINSNFNHVWDCICIDNFGNGTTNILIENKTIKGTIITLEQEKDIISEFAGLLPLCF